MIERLSALEIARLRALLVMAQSACLEQATAYEHTHGIRANAPLVMRQWATHAADLIDRLK
jgi:hypothetical protein